MPKIELHITLHPEAFQQIKAAIDDAKRKMKNFAEVDSPSDFRKKIDEIINSNITISNNHGKMES